MTLCSRFYAKPGEKRRRKARKGKEERERGRSQSSKKKGARKRGDEQDSTTSLPVWDLTGFYLAFGFLLLLPDYRCGATVLERLTCSRLIPCWQINLYSQYLSLHGQLECRHLCHHSLWSENSEGMRGASPWHGQWKWLRITMPQTDTHRSSFPEAVRKDIQHIHLGSSGALWCSNN